MATIILVNEKLEILNDLINPKLQALPHNSLFLACIYNKDENIHKSNPKNGQTNIIQLIKLNKHYFFMT